MGDDRHAAPHEIPRWIEERRAEVLAQIAALGPTLPGCVKTGVMTRCGSPGCHCHDPSAPALHGPYTWWTRQVRAKTVSKAWTPDQLGRYQPWTRDNRRLDALVDELRSLALQAIAAAEGWDPLPAPPRQTPKTTPHQPKHPTP
jgi:hypothetical protein